MQKNYRKGIFTKIKNNKWGIIARPFKNGTAIIKCVNNKTFFHLITRIWVRFQIFS